MVHMLSALGQYCSRFGGMPRFAQSSTSEILREKMITIATFTSHTIIGIRMLSVPQTSLGRLSISRTYAEAEFHVCEAEMFRWDPFPWDR